MSGISLITPTGSRVEAFSLCEYFMQRQTWKDPVQWIIVDDGPQPSIKQGDFTESTIQVSVLRPEPCWKPGENTLARNLLAAIPQVEHELILIIEDDDHYPPDYLERMAEQLEGGGSQVAGSAESRYYHLPTRRFRTFQHRGRSSLCHTGLTRPLLPYLKRACEGNGYIDVDFWESIPHAIGHFLLSNFVTGIKGLPGRPGLGVGHCPTADGAWSDDDARFSRLRSWIGEEDFKLYRRFMNYAPHCHNCSQVEVASLGDICPDCQNLLLARPGTPRPYAQDFEVFTWKGQKRYKCSLSWESGAACEFDTYDFSLLMDHLRGPHRRAVEKQPPPRPAAPKPQPRPVLFDAEGQPVRAETQPPAAGDAGYSFRRE